MQVKKKASSAKKSTTKKRVQSPDPKMKRYRQRLRASGLRPIQIWVPDVRSPVIAEELRRQCLLAKNGPDEEAVMDFIEKIADTDGWE